MLLPEKTSSKALVNLLSRSRMARSIGSSSREKVSAPARHFG